MSEDDSEFGPTSLRKQLSGALFARPDEADSAVGQGTERTTSESSRHLYRQLLTAQALWMILAFGLLVWFDEWSPVTYYITIFNGLLCVRILFAPTAGNPQWWRRLKWVVYGGFVVLVYIVVTQYIKFIG